MKVLKKSLFWTAFGVWQILCLPRYLLCLPILGYRRFLSSAKGAPRCRFTPTCSAYGLQSLLEWGAVLGSLLTVFRLLRCQPLCKGGCDPVPKNPIHRFVCRRFGVGNRIDCFLGGCEQNFAKSSDSFTKIN